MQGGKTGQRGSSGGGECRDIGRGGGGRETEIFVEEYQLCSELT